MDIGPAWRIAVENRVPDLVCNQVAKLGERNLAGSASVGPVGQTDAPLSSVVSRITRGERVDLAQGEACVAGPAPPAPQRGLEDIQGRRGYGVDVLGETAAVGE